MTSALATRPTDAEPRKPAGGEYRPHLDGLRAVAVYLVVAFHAGADRFNGGFIGVDVFFVLSGYLVTQILLRDLNSRGRIGFRRFYARRFRRLLPASFVALILTAVVYTALAAPAEVRAVENAFEAAFLYVANWFFIHRSADYFAANIDTNPVVHYWSLAVEEQFYIVWPLLLGGGYALTRRLSAHRRALQALVALGALASLLWALHLSDTNLTRAYYGTDARAYQLLAGALLALSPGIIRRLADARIVPPVLAALGVVGIVVLSTSSVHLDAIQRGVAATVVSVVLIAAIESSLATAPVNRLLSSRPSTYLGRISYGTYLWHWPIIVFALLLTDRSISPVSMFAISALLATSLASLSYTLLEMPVRQQRRLDRVPVLVIAGGLAIGIVAALVIVPSITTPQDQAKVVRVDPKSATTTGGGIDVFAESRMPADLRDVQWVPGWSCNGKPATACTIIKGSREHILVIGDSTAWAMFPAFAQLAKNENLTLSTAAAPLCPWQQHLYFSDTSTDYLQRRRQQCIDYKRDLYERVLPALKPDLVVAIGINYLDRFSEGGRHPGELLDDASRPVVPAGDGAFRTAIQDDTRRSAAAIERNAKNLLILDPSPRAPGDDPYACLSKSTNPEPCRFVINEQRKTLDAVYADVADGRHVFNADFEKLYCPYAPICDPVIAGHVVWLDVQHVTASYAASLAAPIADYLKSVGLIRPR